MSGRFLPDSFRQAGSPENLYRAWLQGAVLSCDGIIEEGDALG